MDFVSLNKGIKLISPEIGIIKGLGKVARMSWDPFVYSYGILPCNSKILGGERYSGRSGGAGYNLKEAIETTLGEVIERYSSAFYDKNSLKKGGYKDFMNKAIHPKEFALFHPKQYSLPNFPFVPFTENIEIYWYPCMDLTYNKVTLYPASLIFMPFTLDENKIGYSTSTGMAGHYNFYKAILTGIYEIIERDAFVITWFQELDVPKIVINENIRKFISKFFPPYFDFHFFDITSDIDVPTVWGICIGEAEFGDFIAVGSAARSSYSHAIQKVLKEIGQAIPYFRYFLEVRKKWNPVSFEEITSFEDHSLFYIKRKDLRFVFDKWIKKEEEKEVEFKEEEKEIDIIKEIKRILKIFRNKGYNVVCCNLTPPDVREAGFFAVKIMCPQLIPLHGNYNYGFFGGKRLYEVPEKLGYVAKEFDKLNKFPHPFP